MQYDDWASLSQTYPLSSPLKLQRVCINLVFWFSMAHAGIWTSKLKLLWSMKYVNIKCQRNLTTSQTWIAANFVALIPNHMNLKGLAVSVKKNLQPFKHSM